MQKSPRLTRRHALLALAALVAAPAVARRPSECPGADMIIVAGGWILRAGDLDKARAHAA